MSKQKQFVIIASLVVISIGIAGCQKHKKYESTQHSTDTTGSPASTPESSQENLSAPPATDTAVAPPLGNMLTDAGLKRVLSHIESGDEIKDTPEFKLFLEQAARDPNAALAVVKRVLQSTPAYETMTRVYIFDVMMEITHTLNGNDAKKVDEYLAKALPLIERQLAAPLYVALPKQGYTQKEIEQFSHSDLHFYENGIVYANTYRAQHMAVSVLGEAATPYTIRILAEITSNQSIDNRIRQVAGMGVRQVRK